MGTGIIRIGKKQAIRFLLLKQGLLGPYRFHGKDGIVSYLQQAGCIQFDPIDVCGKNPELVLQARVQGLKKGMLYKVLYQDRAAVDYFDKQLSILPVGDWKYFARTRQWFQEYFAGREDIVSAFDIVRREFLHRAFLSSRDLALEQKVDWPWAPTKLSRAALEGLYFCGELVIHHKEGTLKYYAPAKHMLSPELLRQEDPFASDQEFFTWRVFRRIGAVGLLWNRPSDAFLGIDGLKAAQRERAFEVLALDGRITPIQVEGIEKTLYLQKSDLPLLEDACSDKPFRHRTELIAPLDCLMWDRKLIQALFGFSYKWEIYTPVSRRKYGYYVLPILDGERFAGRLEAVCSRKEESLLIKNIWWEQGIRKSERLRRSLHRCLERLRKFHGMKTLFYSDAAKKNL